MKKKLLIFFVSIVVTIIGLVIYFFGAPVGYVKVEGYRHVEPGKASCDALTPGCGYCPGKVKQKECYVKND